MLNHLYHLPSRQLRLVSNAIAGVAPSLINAVTNLHNPGQEGDSLLKHVQALTQHIQQALSISAPPICGCGCEQKPQVCALLLKSPLPYQSGQSAVPRKEPSWRYHHSFSPSGTSFLCRSAAVWIT